MTAVATAGTPTAEAQVRVWLWCAHGMRVEEGATVYAHPRAEGWEGRLRWVQRGSRHLPTAHAWEYRRGGLAS